MNLPDTPFDWPTIADSFISVHFVKGDILIGTAAGETSANAWRLDTGLPLVQDDDSTHALDLDRRPGGNEVPLQETRPYTVVFYVDGDYGVETFVQEVEATDTGTAYDLAVDKAREDGGTSSGRTLSSSDWDNASEISVFVGHGLDAYARD